jgi:hypothetical protein
MDGLAGSTLKDLADVGALYLRRQCSLGVVRVNFERAATRLRLVAPEHAEVVRSFCDLLERIADARPAGEQYAEVGKVLDRFDQWAARA